MRYKINEYLLEGERAEYAKNTVVTVSRDLETQYGRGFAERNVRRTIQFSEVFPDLEIVSPLSTQLGWSHFLKVISITDEAKRIFYLQKAAEENWSVRAMRKQIERKAYERKEIAQIQIKDSLSIPESTFKDPYFLKFLGLKEGYLENDLEAAILKEIELFILELGVGFALVERQKRMII